MTVGLQVLECVKIFYPWGTTCDNNDIYNIINDDDDDK